jgi:hypothetical protein
VTRENSITLCANEFSAKAEHFRASLLYQWLDQRGGLVTPRDLEANRGFLSITDREIDRANESAVCDHLSHKYDLRQVHLLDIKAYSASVVLPDD